MGWEILHTTARQASSTKSRKNRAQASRGYRVERRMQENKVDRGKGACSKRQITGRFDPALCREDKNHRRGKNQKMMSYL